MAESTGAVPQLADPDERGTLDLRVKAIQRIVEQVVRETPGTVSHRSTLGRLTGSNTPRATVSIQANSARVAVQVACVWPCPVAQVVARGIDARRDVILTDREGHVAWRAKRFMRPAYTAVMKRAAAKRLGV